MSALSQLDVGERVWEAATYYDDGDNPIARDGPSSYERSEPDAQAFACSALRGRRSEQPGGFWYATIRRPTRSARAAPTTTHSSRTPTGRVPCSPTKRTPGERQLPHAAIA